MSNKIIMLHSTICFATQRHRKMFNIESARICFEKYARKALSENGIEVHCISFPTPYAVAIEVTAPANYSANQIARIAKKAVKDPLITRFSAFQKMRYLWRKGVWMELGGIDELDKGSLMRFLSDQKQPKDSNVCANKGEEL